MAAPALSLRQEPRKMSNRGISSGQVKVDLQAVITNTMDDGQVASADMSGTPVSGRMTSGVSADEFNRAWADLGRSLGSGVSEDLDLYDVGSIDIGGGAGMDALGQALTFEEITTLVIKQTGGTGRLEINATDPSNKLAWVPTLTVANGGALRIDAALIMHNPDTEGFPVTDGVSHQVKIGANGGTVTYDIYVFGRHDDEASSSSSSSTSSLSSSSTSSSSTSSLSSSSTSTSTSTSTSSGSSSSSSHSISTSSTLTSSTLSSSSSSSSSSSGP